MTRRAKVLVVFGTRPEVIKLAPVVHAAQLDPSLEVVMCSTGQQRELLAQTLESFELKPHHDLGLMVPSQGLSDLTARILQTLPAVFHQVEPDVVVVQGDTSTTFATALAAFHARIPVAHVEAGLRTDNFHEPFPEEANRVLTSRLATLHFAPTGAARDRLLSEGVRQSAIWVTGNPVIDAVRWMQARATDDDAWLGSLGEAASVVGDSTRKVVLVTCHRRENLEHLPEVCRAVLALARRHSDVSILFLVHPNPRIRDEIVPPLRGHPRIHLIEPMAYPHFLRLLARVDLVVTDSGGLQEEAPSLGRPVVVLRQSTERSEMLASGHGVLAGTEAHGVVRAIEKMLGRRGPPVRMLANPFGDGRAGQRIAALLARQWREQGSFELSPTQIGTSAPQGAPSRQAHDDDQEVDAGEGG